MRLARRLARSQAGATMAEFALLAPVFLLFLFGTIEASRLIWMQQTLDEVAYSTARCMSVSSACSGSGAQQSYAVTRASSYGVTLGNADVTAQDDVTCRGFPNSSRVKITHGFESVLGGFVPAFPNEIEVEGCYPALT